MAAMALQGGAFITMWHDVEPSALADFDAWHTHEHMPERVAIPGFLGGRRYWNDTLTRQRCFTLYEGSDADVFRSVAYLERLNNPTPWTMKVQPSFRNFLRVVCDTVASEGSGVGGSIAAWRLTLASGAPLNAAAVIRALRASPAVAAAHVGLSRPDITSYRTAETELRPAGQEAGFDALVLAEGVRHADLAAIVPGLTDYLEAMLGVSAVQSDIYDLAYAIRRDGG
jgi:hypothetical protein